MWKPKFALLVILICAACSPEQSDLPLPTVASLPTLPPTLELTEVVIVPSATHTATAIPPTDTPLPSNTATEASTATSIPTTTPTATVTDTPLPTTEPTSIPGSLKSRIEIGGTMAVPLSAAFLQINDVEAVNISVVPLEDGNTFSVGGDAKVARGSDMLRIATEMRDLSYSTLNTAFLDFWVILDDGTQAVDHMWDNISDEWLITRLTITAVPLPS